MDLTQIIKRHENMVASRSQFTDYWQKISERLLPYSGNFRSQYSPGETKTNRQFDGFPQLALSRYAAAMDSGLTPRQSHWHLLTSGDEDLDEEDDVKAYRETLNNLLWRRRYRPASSFANAHHEIMMSHGAFGNGVLFVDDDPETGNASYQSVHLSEVTWAVDAHGHVDTVHREYKLTARQIRQNVNNKGWTLTQKVSNALQAEKLDQPFRVLHVVMPREDRDPGRLDYKGMRFASCYIILDDKEFALTDQGYREMPYIIARHVMGVGEIYGRGPGSQMFPDIKMLNALKGGIIDGVDMLLDPPVLLSDDGMLSAFRMGPGEQFYGGVDANGRPTAIPFNAGVQPQVGLDLVTDVRNQIDDAFLGVYFRVLLENPQMTATQALLIAQQQGQMVAPTVGRLQSEYLDRLIRRESAILFRYGKHPPMPKKLADYLRAQEERMSLEYDSPMTRAAKAAEVVALQQSFEALAPWAQIVGPDVYKGFDPAGVAKIVVRANGVPTEALKSKDQIEGEEQQAAQQQALAQTLEAAPIAAQTAKTLADAQAAAQAQPVVPGA